MSARQVAVMIGAAAGLLAAPAFAGTWVPPRTTPKLDDIVAIDATGENLWPYGAEDVAGDGIPTFKEPEQSDDIRTVYAKTDATHFWIRAYVSSLTAVSMTDTVYVFVDTDDNAQTGGPASATSINPKLTTDPTAGGYEYVLSIKGDGTVPEIWQWNTPMMSFVGAAPKPANAHGESGADNDPLDFIGPTHGYLQATVDLDLLGLTEACGSKLFIRSVDSMTGYADLDVYKEVACIPVDDNDDGVPDMVLPPGGCKVDADCPAKGICVNGACEIPEECTVDADCKMANDHCDNGDCVPKPGGPCKVNTDCGDLVCENAVCTSCTQGGNQCGAGMRCGPRGRCVADPESPTTSTTGTAGTSTGGIPINPGDVVQGGACACALHPTRERDDALAMLLGVGFAVLLRLRRSRRNAGRES